MERGQSDDFAELTASALSWWADAGVDTLVSDAPRDWLKVKEVEKPLVPSEVEGRKDESPDQPGLPGTNAPRLRSGRAEVASPGELPDQLALFHEYLRASDALPYAAPGAARVCPSGDPAAGLMIMVAMPSTEDCGAGTLLSGASGRLFDRMLAAIGRSRDTVYLTGLSCLRPPAGRLDAAGAGQCAQVALHHVGLAAPKALLLMGDACARALLGLGAAQARGRVHAVETPAGSFRAVVTWPPEYLLSQPAAKALAWADLQLLMEALQ